MTDSSSARLKQLRSMPYYDYLTTPEWQATRKAALEYANHACQLCNASNLRLHVHHRTYERKGCELPADLFVLCERCHGVFHEKIALPARFVTPYFFVDCEEVADALNDGFVDTTCVCNGKLGNLSRVMISLIHYPDTSFIFSDVDPEDFHRDSNVLTVQSYRELLYSHGPDAVRNQAAIDEKNIRDIVLSFPLIPRW